MLLVYRYRVAEGILTAGVRPQEFLSIRGRYVRAQNAGKRERFGRDDEKDALGEYVLAH